MKIKTLLLFFLLFMSFNLYGLKPEKEYKVIPSDYGIIYKEISIPTTDGLTLKAWFYPSQDTSGIANNIIGRMIPVPDEFKKPAREYNFEAGKKFPTIIICDGDAGNMMYSIFYAYHFFTQGYNVFTFDWRGFGESSDWKINEDNLCYKEFLDDYDVAIDYVKLMPEVDTNKIAIMGFSTGAYLSFAMLAKRNEVSAFCGRALITSFEDLLDNIAELDTTRKFIVPNDYPEELLPVNCAGKITKPAFLVVGEKDIRTPPWMSERIFELLKGPKELWIVPGAEHGGRNCPELYNYPEFFNKAVSFFNKHLPAQD